MRDSTLDSDFEESPPSVVVDAPAGKDLGEFWEGVKLPVNDVDPKFEFVNPVVAAQWFAKKTADIATISGIAERLEEEIANLKVHLRRAQYDLSRFRQQILTDHYGAITKSAKEDVQAAFVARMARESGKENILLGLEQRIEKITRDIEVRVPRRDQLYSRLKALKDSADSARQFLDYAKLEMRVNGQVR